MAFGYHPSLKTSVFKLPTKSPESCQSVIQYNNNLKKDRERLNWNHLLIYQYSSLVISFTEFATFDSEESTCDVTVRLKARESYSHIM